ncbi:Major facilitator superfamily domain general substrate transporter [Penicillium capsulatum]|uniref:Major facilitator superfamily domain general substrate transporter n=1 Tax=Penicillium capsulatum TaxID=69766 RepID=A0A9W9IHU1_9EURO|nr:Major facilitator superfamily domain general substrate transporter [Penicillium capsulatum]KAJ6122834.1 Major facilitator superfamily domain general substrate transporter [Penicillium capsulatum]
MDFLRDLLKLPVLRVLSYSTSSDNSVVAEYILMERVEGESLSSRWLSLTTEEVKHTMTRFSISIFLRTASYITKRTLSGTATYQSWMISVLVLCLPGSFGMANEARQKLIVGRTALPLQLAKRWLFLQHHANEWNESEQLPSRVKEHLCIDPEGGTEPDNYERAIEANRQFRMEMVRQAEVDQQKLAWQNWPFKYTDDNSMPPFGDS